MEWEHGSGTGQTQVESDTYSATWFHSCKIPYEPEKGISFKVDDLHPAVDHAAPTTLALTLTLTLTLILTLTLTSTPT